jgi:hypothetical protein
VLRREPLPPLPPGAVWVGDGSSPNILAGVCFYF